MTISLGACTVERPEPIACDVEKDGYLIRVDALTLPPAELATALTESAPLSEYEAAVLNSLQSALDQVPRALEHDLEHDVAVVPKTLALSGGGPWGAYGAGFMKEWKDELNGFPRFATVTGVSTGALQATFAFLGGENLDHLDSLYRNVGNRDIYTKRNELYALLGASAFNSLDPLRDLIRNEIEQNDWLAAVRREAELGRKLFVGIVDLDSGNLFAADLTRVVRDDSLSQEQKLTCYTELLIASAAVPVAFDPVATESSDPPARRRLLVDGGVRAAAFIESSERALDRFAALTSTERSEFGGETVVVINGMLDTCKQNTEGGILSIGERSIGILINQNNVNSLSNILFRRATKKQCTRYTFVEFASEICATDVDTTSFDPVFMNLLADHGKKRWQSGEPFESVGTCEAILP